jgi:hypothetical protein
VTPRPRRDRPKGGRPLTVPLTADERARIAAAADGMPEATWARGVLLRAAKERPR